MKSVAGPTPRRLTPDLAPEPGLGRGGQHAAERGRILGEVGHGAPRGRVHLREAQVRLGHQRGGHGEQCAARQVADQHPPRRVRPVSAQSGDRHDRPDDQEDIPEGDAEPEAEGDLPGGDGPAGEDPAGPGVSGPVAVAETESVPPRQHGQGERDPAGGQDVQVPAMGQTPGGA